MKLISSLRQVSSQLPIFPTATRSDMFISLLLSRTSELQSNGIIPFGVLSEVSRPPLFLHLPDIPPAKAQHSTRSRVLASIAFFYVAQAFLCASRLTCIQPWLSVFVRFPFPDWGRLLSNNLSDMPLSTIRPTISNDANFMSWSFEASMQADCPYGSKRVKVRVGISILPSSNEKDHA
ncbi:uncharacterized protein F4812DRAFT_340446 [Daldinia caldariorum]|uniref:uncharacterized protein n=1 Tax=Daldinia caldariorum TaxID=326644 RepID=UPI002007904A|nr:uncharacterized protein F4812DRAFT_340446 [Daldinia caldariorum]KAI1468691.1 hypothetical protein F4812DRAFT_340446 [Daldinia caldariorum]